MTLSSEVQARVSSQKLIELTNQDDRTATTIDTTILDAAIADAGAEFTDETNLNFDDSNARHIRVGIIGVLAYLESYVNMQTQAYKDLRQQFERAMAKIAVSLGAEKRLLPSSKNTTTPSTPRVGQKPEQDRTRWDSIVPNMPGGGGAENDFTI
jgi:hypothetical protein